MPVSGRSHLVVMGRTPQLGRVKTRLAKDIGAVEALRFYRSNFERALRLLGKDPRWSTHCFIKSREAGVFDFPKCADAVCSSIIPQIQGDLGSRMLFALNHFSGKRILIGSDIPGIAACQIRLAFRMLGKNDLVFGPAEDGGFWLVGVREGILLKNVFQDINWSTNSVLADVMHRSRDYRIAVANTLWDVDRGSEYQRWRNEY